MGILSKALLLRSKLSIFVSIWVVGAETSVTFKAAERGLAGGTIAPVTAPGPGVGG